MLLVGGGVGSRNRQSTRRKSLLRTSSPMALLTTSLLPGRKDLLVDLSHALDHGFCRELLTNSRFTRRRQPPGKIRVGQNRLNSRGQGGWVSRRHEETGLPVNDGLIVPTYRRGNHRFVSSHGFQD